MNAEPGFSRRLANQIHEACEKTRVTKRLEAAAPDLLAACEAVMNGETSAPNMIRAAIAKAKGQAHT